MQILRKVIVIILLISLMVFACYPAGAQIIPISQLSEVEEILLGVSNEGSILNRIQKLENILYGGEREGSLVERSTRIVDYVLPSTESTSLLFSVNTLEWSLKGRVSDRALLDKIDEMEEQLLGRVNKGSVKSRVDRLLTLSLPAGEFPARKIKLPKDTLLRVKLLDKLSSREAEEGQKIEFEVTGNISRDSSLVIARGTRGVIEVISVERAGKMGRDGEIRLQFSDIKTLDGTPVSLKIDEESQEENRSQNLAVGASLLGTVLLGPVGLIAGYFVEGQEEELPAGSEMYIQTGEEIETFGYVME